jgi:hypothetical protein
MAQAYVYRDTTHTPLLERVAEALTNYRRQQGHLPPKITVHKPQVDAARAALKKLGIAIAAIEGLGGCLANEIWLWVPEPEEEPCP